MMKKFMDKVERKFGRYALHHLTYIMIIGWVLGYAIELMDRSGTIISYMTLNMHLILHGQIWRLFTWFLIPPNSLSVMVVLMIFFFYIPIGNALERTWGDFRYNFFMFNGMLIFVITALICYFIFGYIVGSGELVGQAIGSFFTTYYISQSLVFAFAATFPDSTVLLMFVIPFKMKWLGWIYAASMIYDAVRYIRQGVTAIQASGSAGTLYFIPVIAMLAAVLNFVLFFSATKQRVHLTKQQRATRKAFRTAEKKWKSNSRNMQRTRNTSTSSNDTKNKVVQGPKPRHRCEVCGRTDISNPELEFRYCTKCHGNHEYCMDHLYNHKHHTEDE